MGVEAAKGIRTRQRETAARVDRLIAHRDRRAPGGGARGQRIWAAVQVGRRALRARAAAQVACDAAEVRAGDALTRIVTEGVALSDACEALGVSRGVGRRLFAVVEATTRAVHRGPSTDGVTEDAAHVATDHGQSGVATTRRAPAEGIS
jgi:hypothetical protein